MTDQLDALKQMTDAQARDIRAQMLDAGQLPPPPGAVTLDRAKLPASLDALRDALSGHAMAWGSVPRTAHRSRITPTVFYMPV